jgi:hypothetical protein
MLNKDEPLRLDQFQFTDTLQNLLMKNDSATLGDYGVYDGDDLWFEIGTVASFTAAGRDPQPVATEPTPTSPNVTLEIEVVYDMNEKRRYTFQVHSHDTILSVKVSSHSYRPHGSRSSIYYFLIYVFISCAFLNNRNSVNSKLHKVVS